MKIIFGITGLILGAWIGDWEGSLFGCVIGVLVGAHLNSSDRIGKLENEFEKLQQKFIPQGTTTETGSAVEETPTSDTSMRQPPVSTGGWNEPEAAKEIDRPEEVSLSTEGAAASITTAEPAIETEAAHESVSEATASTEVPYSPGPFESIETAIKNFFTTGNVVVKVGMIILFFGVSFLLKYAAQKNLFPIELRLACVAAGAIALLIFAWRLRLRKPVYALVLQGGAVGILYLTVFSAARLYNVLPVGFVFAVMVALVVFSCILAVIQDARSLAIFATVGGFLAPILTSTGQGSHVALFSYYGLLNAGILGIAWHKAWRSLNWFGFVFTFVIASMWGARYYQPQFFNSTEPFLILFFLFYVAIPVLYAYRQPPELKGLVDGTLVFGTPLVGFALQSALVRNYEFGQAYSALAMGGLYLILARALWYKQIEGMRMLTESFLALSVIFISLAVPLAMDGHWTAATWSLEGAGITWVSIRQNRLSGRIFGLLLQIGAGIAFLSAIDLPHGYTPVFNSTFLGSAMISIAGLFTGYQYYKCRDECREEERGFHVALMIWGLLWWFGAGITELDQYLSRDYEINIILLFISMSFAVLFIVGRKVHWPVTAWPPLFLLPVMIITAGIVFIDSVHAQPFEKLGYLTWSVSLMIQYYLLYQAANIWQRSYILFWHAATLWLVMFLLSWFISHVLVEHVHGMQNWDLIFWGVVPATFVMLLLNFGERLQWPVKANDAAYLGTGLFPVVAWLAMWTLLLCFKENNPEPLTWLPVLNPYDIAQLFVMFNLFNWCWSLRQKLIPDVPEVQADKLLMILAGIVFIWINSLVGHAIHFYADVPYRLSSLMQSELFQTSITILWTVIALAMMLSATRIDWRRLWLTGGVLLAITIVKLFIVDLADSGTVTRIISFLTVGGLMLVIGYFSPVPPKQARDLPDNA